MQENKINRDVINRISRIPIVDTLGFEFIELENGVCKTKVKYNKIYDGIFESFHGGLLMTIADSAAAFAILTLTGANAEITTTDMNIRFLAACRTDVTAHASVIKHGKTLVPVSVELFDENKLKVAIAQVNYMKLNR